MGSYIIRVGSRDCGWGCCVSEGGAPSGVWSRPTFAYVTVNYAFSFAHHVISQSVLGSLHWYDASPSPWISPCHRSAD